MAATAEFRRGGGLGAASAEAAGGLGVPLGAAALALPVITGCGALRDGGAGGATGTVEVVFLPFAVAVLAGADPPAQGLGIVKAVGVVAEVPSATHARSGTGFVVVVEVGGAAGLFRRHTPEPHALVAEEDGGGGQQELTELKDRIQAPALEKENAAAEQADGGKKHVVVASQSRLEAPHEIEESPADGQHDPDNAGPIQAGVNHRSIALSGHCRAGVETGPQSKGNQSLRSTRSFWLIRITAAATGMTTITAPQRRLLRKLAREGVMTVPNPPAILGSDGNFLRLRSRCLGLCDGN